MAHQSVGLYKGKLVAKTPLNEIDTETKMRLLTGCQLLVKIKKGGILCQNL